MKDHQWARERELCEAKEGVWLREKKIDREIEFG